MKNMMTSAEVLTLRKKLRKTQAEFWGPIGATQSAGSRYETGRNIPKPIQTLIGIAYGKNPEKIVAKLRGENG